jgi:hypothetical protein
MFKHSEVSLSIISEALCITRHIGGMLDNGCIIFTENFTISKINVYALIPKSTL